jgi:hypothetical protein
MKNLDTLKSRAEAVQASFEREHAELFRPDGSKLYSDSEHDERENTLRAERHQKLTGIQAEVEAERAAALEELELIENADPTTLLSDDELRRADARRGFISDEVWALPEDRLVARLKAVRAGGNRALMFAYWQAAKAHESVRADAMGQKSLPSDLTRLLDEVYDELGGPDRRRQIEVARAQEAKAGDVLMAVGSLKSGGSTSPATSYLNQKYAREK